MQQTINYDINALILEEILEAINIPSYDQLLERIPCIKWSEIKPGIKTVSFYLVCKKNTYATRFFHDVLVHWLNPGHRMDVIQFLKVQFEIPGNTGNTCSLYTAVKIQFKICSDLDLSILEKNLFSIETEIRLGVHSQHQALHILESKGFTNDQKIALVQEQIAIIWNKHQQDLDEGVFNEMQHFMIISSTAFKQGRDHRLLSRIICVHYIFRKRLRQQISEKPEHYLHLKLCKSRLYHPYQNKNPLSVIIGLNLLGEHELFEKRHLLHAIQHIMPGIIEIPDSFLINFSRKENMAMLYIEVEKPDESSFSLEEIKKLYNQLPLSIQSRIEKRHSALFMPHNNEEEIMRYMVALHNQLKFVSTPPQVVILFEKQTELHINFTIILCRVIKNTSEEVSDLLKLISKREFVYKLDRIKVLGKLRNKYPKEGSVIQVQVPKNLFLRQDQSVDFYKSRSFVFMELNKIFEDLRDYNGGMLSKEVELLNQLKVNLCDSILGNEFLLENFFYSLIPSASRAIASPAILYQTFLSLVHSIQSFSSETFQEQINQCIAFHKDNYVCAIFLTKEHKYKIDIKQSLSKRNFGVQLFISSELEVYNIYYLTYVYRASDSTEAKRFLLEIDEFSQHIMSSFHTQKQ